MKKFIYVLFIFVMMFMVGGNAMATQTALSLNGSQCLTITDSAQSGLDITGDLAILQTFTFGTINSSTNNSFVNKWGVSGQLGHFFRYESASSTLRLAISNNGTAFGDVGVSWSPVVGTKYFIGVVYTASSGTATFYVNGVQQGTTQSGLPTSIFNNNQPFCIGANYNGGWPCQYFNGTIDNISVWSKTLTATEIANIYNGTTVLTGAETGLAAYYKFDGNLASSTSVSNALTLNSGTATYVTALVTTTEIVTPVTVTPTASNPITTVIGQGVAAGLSIGTSQQYLVVGKDASSVYYLAIAETTGTFIKSIALTSGYVPLSVTQVISGGTASTTQVSVLSTNAGKYYNLLVNTSTGAITPVAW